MYFELRNLGPFEASDVSLELLTPSLHALTPLAWQQVAVKETWTFGVEVPVGNPRQAKLRWKQGEHVFTREIELPTGRVKTYAS